MEDRSKYLEPAPEPDAWDYAIGAAKVGGLAFPFLGSGIAFFDLVTAPIRGKRATDWCERLRLGLNELSEKVAGLTPEKLAASEEFNSAFARASQAAMRTHQAEKLDTLRNAVLNVAVGNAPSVDLQTMFLNIIDTMTPLHIAVLHLIEHPNPTVRDVLRKQGDVANHVVADLNSRGLLKDRRPYAARNREENELLIAPWEISPLGKQFLSFIKSPIALP
jgi:hypothetical protein